MLVRPNFLLPRTYSYHLVPRDGDEKISEENKLGTVRCPLMHLLAVEPQNPSRSASPPSNAPPRHTTPHLRTHPTTLALYQINFIWNTYQIRSPMSNASTGIVLCARDKFLSMNGKRYFDFVPPHCACCLSLMNNCLLCS